MLLLCYYHCCNVYNLNFMTFCPTETIINYEEVMPIISKQNEEVSDVLTWDKR